MTAPYRGTLLGDGRLPWGNSTVTEPTMPFRGSLSIARWPVLFFYFYEASRAARDPTVPEVVLFLLFHAH